MLEIGALVILLGVLVFASHFFAWLFSHVRIPDALLLMLVGVVLGPVLGLVSPDQLGDSGELLVTIVLVVLLFQSGLGLDFSVLRRAWRETLGLAVTSFFVTMLVVGIVLWAVFGFDLLVAFMVGSIVGGTSSAVVIPMLKRMKLGGESETTLLLESVFSDVLTIVVTIALLEAIGGGGARVLSLVPVQIVWSFFGAAVLGVGVALLWSRLLRVIRHMENSIFTTPALVFILFGLAEYFGFSGPIAALAFGVMLGNIGKMNKHFEERNHLFWRYLFMARGPNRRERLFFAEVVFLLQTFFFVFVGISVRLTSWSPVVLGMGLAALMALTRLVVVRFVVPKSTGVKDATVMAVMIPKGLAAAALASLPLQRGLAQGSLIEETTYSIVLFSVIITSLLVFALDRPRLASAYESFLSKFSSDKRYEVPGA